MVSGVALVTAFLHSDQENSFQDRFENNYPKKDTIYHALLSNQEIASNLSFTFNNKPYTPRQFIDWAISKWDSHTHTRLIPESFDYRPIISQLDIPVLNIFGSEDRRHLADFIVKFNYS